MLMIPRIRWAAAAGGPVGWLVAGLAVAGSSAAAREDGADVRSRPHDIVGSLSCSSASCHGAVEPRRGAEKSQGQEYLHWLNDPHAAAGRRLLEPRFQEVLQRASRMPDGAADSQVFQTCASCHDPVGRDTMANERGIGCESCHGGARQWLTTHYERDISREQLHELGMVETKHVVTRARLCASCHVGSAENDVNHDLLAAGHPPLRFEMASYQALLDRKHWDDGPRRFAEPDYEVQLWAAGKIASAEAALALLEARARQAIQANTKSCNATKGAAKSVPWPEFAEWNCFSCHQSLRPKAGQPALTAGLRRPPGVPSWQSWNLEFTSGVEGEAITHLRMAMQRSLTPPPDEISRLASQARDTLLSQVRLAPGGAVLDSAGKPVDARGLLESLGAGREAPTWDRCCQELAALVAAERAIRDHEKRAGTASVPAAFQERVRRVVAALRFADDRYEWPAVFSQVLEPGTFTMSLDEAAAELEAMRHVLIRQCQLLGAEY